MKLIHAIGISLILFLFTSCSETPKNLQAIPKDVNLVGVIDLYGIAKKGQLAKMPEMKFYRKLKKEAKKENKKLVKLIDKFVKDPLISGISFTSDIYVFYSDNARDEKFVAVSFELSNPENFAFFAKDFIKKLGFDFDEENDLDYRYSPIGKKSIVGWDDNKAIFLQAVNYKSRKNLDIGLEELMSTKEENQLCKNADFNDFLSRKKDLSVFISTNLMEESNDFDEIENAVDYSISDNSIATFLSFDEDNISLSTRIYANSELHKLQTESKVLDHDFDSELLDFLPEKNYLFSSASINLPEVWKLLEDNDIVSEKIDRIKEYEDLNIEEIVSSFGGSFAYSLIGFEDIEYSYKDWGYAFDPSIGVPLEKKIEINEAEYLSVLKKEKLNAGETVKGITISNVDYCLNIQNILDEGGNVELAIARNAKVNWFKGGWNYGKNIEKTKEEYLPLMCLSFDLLNNDFLKQIIKKADLKFTKKKGYYEFKLENRYPVYLIFNETKCLVSNDMNTIKYFSEGGYEDRNLSNAPFSGEVKRSSGVYLTAELDFNSYDKKLKKMIKSQQRKREYKVFKIWSELGERATLKSEEFGSYELDLKLKPKNANSLHTLLKAALDSYDVLDY
jgi:hypothetical protein